MLEMLWLDHDHVRNGSVSGAIEMANELHWNLSVAEDPPDWLVYSGEKVLLKADSKESIDAFLYGVGLAYGSLPEETFSGLRESVRRLLE